MTVDCGVIRYNMNWPARSGIAMMPILWTPKDLPSLVAWYVATAGVYSDAGTTLATDGQTVQQWNDQSGNGNNISQATSGKRPTYNAAGFNSKQTVTFAAASLQQMASGANAVGFNSNAMSCFVVGQMLTGTAANGRAASFVANGQSADYDNLQSAVVIARNSTNNAFIQDIALNLLSANISLATNYRLGMTATSASYFNYINNSQAATNTTAGTCAFGGASHNGTFRVGSSPADECWDGPISEVVLTQAVISSADRALLDTYFQAKWGL